MDIFARKSSARNKMINTTMTTACVAQQRRKPLPRDMTSLMPLLLLLLLMRVTTAVGGAPLGLQAQQFRGRYGSDWGTNFKTPPVNRKSTSQGAAPSTSRSLRKRQTTAFKQKHDGQHRGIRGGTSSSTSMRRPSLFVRFGARGRLTARLLSDFTAATIASLMVSPFISIADRAIIQSTSGSMSMTASMQQGLRVLATKPVLFLARPDFLFTFGLFGGTYLAANAISTIADEIKRSDTWPRFFGTTAINMPGSIVKDQALTKLFGAVGGDARVPMASFALFTVRDLATMAAAFTLPTPMSAKMQEEFGVTSGWADTLSQLVSPGLVQLFSTPVHILGLDMYNHPGASMSQRVKVVQQSFAPAIGLRVARIGVAFGLGGLGNTGIRKHLHAAIAAHSD